jgi:hypothetical protein
MSFKKCHIEERLEVILSLTLKYARVIGYLEQKYVAVMRYLIYNMKVVESTIQ